MSLVVAGITALSTGAVGVGLRSAFRRNSPSVFVEALKAWLSYRAWQQSFKENRTAEVDYLLPSLQSRPELDDDEPSQEGDP